MIKKYKTSMQNRCRLSLYSAECDQLSNELLVKYSEVNLQLTCLKNKLKFTVNSSVARDLFNCPFLYEKLHYNEGYL